MQATPAHRPPKTDHVHRPLPLETAFDFLNTLELENGALVERLTSRDVAHAVAHEDRPMASAIEEVNRALAARERIELVASPDGVLMGHSHSGDAIDDVLARIAEPIVREIGGGHEERFRICANDTCRWIFYDESRSGQRRWCDMATCGNRAKAQRHRARQKETGAEAPLKAPARTS